MPDGNIQVAASQTGERVRTATKVQNPYTVHEQYVVPDVPWTVWGSFSWSASFLGTATGPSILAALLRPAGAANRDIVVRVVLLGYFNEGVATANSLFIARSAALPGSNSAVAQGNILRKVSSAPAPTALAYIKPTGVVVPTVPAIYPLSKSAAANEIGSEIVSYEDTPEPFVLASTDSLCICQSAAGTATESWQLGFEWQEVTL